MVDLIRFSDGKIGFQPFDESKPENKIVTYSALQAFIRKLAAKFGLGSGIFKFTDDNNNKVYLGRKRTWNWVQQHSNPDQKFNIKDMEAAIKEICRNEIARINCLKGKSQPDQLPPNDTPQDLPSGENPPHVSLETPLPKPVETQDQPEKSSEEVFLLKLADSGDSHAQANLGNYYLDNEQYPEALDWFGKSAAQKNPEGFYGIAQIHARELVENSCEKTAFINCFEAAKLGHSEAMVQLAYFYKNGTKQIPPNHKKAHACFKEAAANSSLGRLHLVKFWLEKEKPESFAKKRAYAVCQNAIDVHHDDDIELLNYASALAYEFQDEENAFEYAFKAAQFGNSVAQQNLGNMYYNGFGVDQSYPEAFQYFQAAADDGQGESQVMLAYMYFNGIGCEPSVEAARHYFELVSERNDPYLTRLLHKTLGK